MTTTNDDVGAPTPGFTLVPLKLIDANPWQPRLSYDDGYLRGLAESISQHRDIMPATKGLLQLPAGRWVDERFQLAYGHNRWRVFLQLAGEDSFYAMMPVTVGVFDDEAMATMAWQENSKRKDLNAIEEAKAITRYADEFGWTDTQIGAKLGLDRSTVAHKRALLKLPEGIQRQLASGQVSSRSAAALVKLARYNLFSDPLANNFGGRLAVRTLVESLPESTSTKIRDHVDEIVRYRVKEIPEEIRTTPLEGNVRIRHATCGDCPFLFGSECSEPECRGAKKNAYEHRQSRLAAESQGLSYLERSGRDFHSDIRGHPETVAYARETTCENFGVGKAYSANQLGEEVEGIPLAYACKQWLCACYEHCRDGAEGMAQAVQASQAAPIPSAPPFHPMPPPAAPSMANAQTPEQAMQAAHFEVAAEIDLEYALATGKWKAWAAVINALCYPDFPHASILTDEVSLAKAVVALLADYSMDVQSVLEQAGVTPSTPHADEQELKAA